MQLKYNTQRVAKGFSLIEVLVALAISSFILLGLSQVFIQSNQSYFVLDSSTEVQENARFSLTFINDALQKAGYRPLPSTAANIPDHSQIYLADGLFTLPGQVILGINGADPAPAAPNTEVVKPDTDIVVMRGIGDAYLETHDCAGNVVAANDVYIMTFYVNTDNALICDVNNADKHTMVDNIATLQALYGVNRCAAGTTPCLQYMRASDINGVGLASWDNVMSVKIGLLAMSSNTVFPGLDATAKNVLDADYTLPVDDQRRSTQLYTDTILLRNMRP